MKPLFLHIGMPKTGTTSIQSTLFWNPPTDLFRFISLDTDFGNLVLVGAFAHDFETSRNFFACLVKNRQRKRFSIFARHYLEACLTQCKNLGATPIISAESVWRFAAKDLQRLKYFAESRGFSVRVIGYLRPPLDYAQSIFQQRIKIARPCSIADSLQVPLEIPRIIAIFDDVFGPENVHLNSFVPNEFPGGCVVHHFYNAVGLDFHSSFVRRENESMNLNAVKFMLAWRHATFRDQRPRLTRIRCRILLDALQSLEGPPVRFHPCLTDELRSRFDSVLPAIEKRIQQKLPWTASELSSEYELKSEADLWVYSKDSLEWLSKASGSPIPQSNTTSEQTAFVSRQLIRLSNRPSVWKMARVLFGNSQIRIHRQSQIRRLKKSTSFST